jgi:hypothetical protein
MTVSQEPRGGSRETDLVLFYDPDLLGLAPVSAVRHPALRLAGRVSANQLEALWCMCGRLPFGKGCFEVAAKWSGAVMCSACLRGSVTAGPNTIRRVGSQSKARV